MKNKVAVFGMFDGAWENVFWNTNHGFLQNSFRLLELGLYTLPATSVWAKIFVMGVGTLGLSLESFGKYLDEKLGFQTSEDFENAMQNPEGLQQNIQDSIKAKLNKNNNKKSYLYLSKKICKEAAYGRRVNYNHYEHSVPKREIPEGNLTKREKEQFIQRQKMRDEENKNSLLAIIQERKEHVAQLQTTLEKLKNEYDSLRHNPIQKQRADNLFHKITDLELELTQERRNVKGSESALNTHYNENSTNQYYKQLRDLKTVSDPNSGFSKALKLFLGDSLEKEGLSSIVMKMLSWFIGSTVYLKIRDVETQYLNTVGKNKRQEPEQPEEAESAGTNKNNNKVINDPFDG